MLVSVITTACNQGDWVRKTIPLAVESLGSIPHELIVVDDQSVDGCCHGLPPDVLIVRTEQRVGCSAARRIGVSKSRGDVLIFTDPHCEYPNQALHKIARLAKINKAIVQPPTKSRPKSSRVAYGGQLTTSDRGIVVRTSPKQARPWPALIGTIYAVQRDVYDHMGGWPELPGCWGYSEQAMTLLAWSCGVPILVADTDICIHYAYQTNGKFPFFTSTSERAKNAHYVHAAFFPAGYTETWRPMLISRFGREGQCDQALLDRQFRTLRRHIMSRSIITEQSIMERIVWEHDVPRIAPPQDAGFVAEQRGRALEMGTYKSRPRIKRSIEWLEKVIPGCLQGRTVLDLCTHDGIACDYYREHGVSRFLGVDIVQEMVARAKKKGRPVVHADMRHMGDMKANWDIVSCVHGLEHVNNPEVAIAEMVRLVKPGGWLFVIVPREAEPNRSMAHHCAFPDSRHLKRMLHNHPHLDPKSTRLKVAKYTDDEMEIRIVIQKKRAGAIAG